MDRRKFIQSLAALSVTPAIPALPMPKCSPAVLLQAGQAWAFYRTNVQVGSISVTGSVTSYIG